MNITPHPFKAGDLVSSELGKSLAVVLKTLPRRRVRVVWMDNMEISEDLCCFFDLIQSSTNIGYPTGRPVEQQVHQLIKEKQ